MPTITALVAAFVAWVQWHAIYETVLGWREHEY